MGVQLNIKDERTVALARTLAERLGKSLTATIREALEEKDRAREREQAARLAEIQVAVREIQNEVRRRMSPDTARMTLKEVMDSIYDDDEPDGFAR